MTVCCDSSPMSGKRGNTPSSSPSGTDVSVNRRKVSCKRFRSTKGASKARRDHINAEIRSMRRLLPISPEDQERLSYLHSMSAICTYVRKSLFFQELRPKEEESSCILYEEFLQALPGFIVAMTREGKLIYVSENVTEYLGFSMVDLLQGDSFYSMVERKELNIVKSHLEDHCTDVMEKAFVCRMHTSKSLRVRQGGSCTMLVRGRFQSVPQSSAACPDLDRAFVALCTPTVNRLKDDDLHKLPQSFRTVHRPDMTFMHACESVPFYLGYSSEDIIGRSWYNLLHPEDLVLGVEAHKILLQLNDGTPVEMILRLQCTDWSWKRLYVRAAKDTGKQTVTCTNHIISETEAEFLVQKIYTDIHGPSRCTHLRKSSQRPALPHICLCQNNGAVTGLKRQRLPSSPSEQPPKKTSRFMDPEVSGTVPTNQACEEGSSLADHWGAMSPTSSHSPAPSHSPTIQEEEAESDFLLEIYDPEELLSLQEGLPSYLSFQDSRCGPSGPLSASESLQPIVGHGFPLSDINEASTRSPEPCPSPSLSYDFPSCPADARLVPDCLPTPVAYEGLSDCTFHPEALVQPTNDSASAGSFFAPLPDPAPPVTSDLSPSPTSGVSSGSVFPYSQEEQEEISILAWQISSMASSFDTYRFADHEARTLGNGYERASPDRSGCGSVSDPPAQVTSAAGRMFSWSQPTPRPVKPELVLDEGVIDCILKDLGRVPGVDSLSCSGPVSSSGPVATIGPRSGQQALGAAATIHSDVLSFAALVEDLSHEQPLGGATALDTHILTTGPQENIELNQLNHFIHRDHQQGKFTVRYTQV
ncbi:neuronal PAS domain-containing protein 4-like isoform X1 [Anguilla anguilla]|uniref:neuronal PAS domain-containing protein 4-like isoform X1 n=2 Tax=Anguilla anguilla TaxID=7936 RepID=UPI0015B01FE0|nr:neuronal PAS domain-containing protein 4-like isoform X1 [Anguilla anguilla]